MEGLIRKKGGIVCGDGAELYFEEDRFDAFLNKRETISEIDYAHPIVELRWGQRGIRFRPGRA